MSKCFNFLPFSLVLFWLCNFSWTFADVPPENETTGYIFIHAEGGLNQQRIAVWTFLHLTLPASLLYTQDMHTHRHTYIYNVSSVFKGLEISWTIVVKLSLEVNVDVTWFMFYILDSGTICPWFRLPISNISRTVMPWGKENFW